eukprot:CAMPEP_0115210358 /NCGR_PEP_ID=MMETSP0270-20121206/22207_1 /TAXON_ID=71861 /ORGANISM="Scrippsiella trochoidea, Strain CCMP3099" /LENGTH=857 /DNA_ID=CAMNT_0002624013 /DNA_START=77 /DNA_END=2646 /DNA_ORIENTATION=+
MTEEEKAVEREEKAEEQSEEKCEGSAKEVAEEEPTKEDSPKEEAKAALLKPKEPEKPKEQEEDAMNEAKPKIGAGSVDTSPYDSTLNVVSSNGGRLLMTLSQGGFQYLLAGARTTVGLTSGRYMFEVKVIETHTRQESPGQQARVPMPRHLVRLGLSHAGSSLFLGDGEGNVSIDSEGFFQEGKNRKKVSQKFGRDVCITFLINLDAGSPNANTISLFREGIRICEPQAIPENMLGKPLYPTITYKNVTLQMNYGPAPCAPLPFKCYMLAEAAEADVELAPVPAAGNGKCKVVVPVGLPEQGFFDWVDAFIDKNPDFVELSDRKILEWAAKSGMWRQKSGALYSNDKPDMKFGIPQFDDMSASKLLAQVAPTVRRNFVIPELRSNLLQRERSMVLKNFSSPDFKKVATVIMGEPSDEHKAKVQELLVAEKKETIMADRKKKVAEEERKRLLEERKKKVEQAKLLREGKKFEDVKDEEEQSTKEHIEEDVEVELTDEEKALWYRKGATQDVLEVTLAKSYVDFSIPTAAEGFDEVNFAWQAESDCSKILKDWIFAKKLTQRVDDITPGFWFKEHTAEWTKTLGQWRKLANEWKNPTKKNSIIEKKKEAKKKEAEEKGEEAPNDMDIDAEDIDVSAVEDVTDIGSGEPLFANFAHEDWTLLSARVDFHFLLHAFKKDLNDPDRPSFTEKDAAFYFNKYFKKAFNLNSFGTNKFERFVALVKDTVAVNEKSALLEAVLPDDTLTSTFVKLTEEHRRERQRRLDAGDESAELKFPQTGASAPAHAGPASITPRVGFPAGSVGRVGVGGAAGAKGTGGVRPLYAGAAVGGVRPPYAGVVAAGLKRPAVTPPQTTSYIAKQPR